MASIIPIGRAHALRDRSRSGPLDPSAIDPRDLVGAMDGRTRELLARAPAARRNRLLPGVLVVADVIGLSLALLIASLVHRGSGAFASTQSLAVSVLSLPCWIIVASLLGMYRRDQQRVHHRTTDEIVRIFQLITIGAWLPLLAARLEGWHAPGVLYLALSSLLTICIVPVTREVARRGSKRAGAYAQNTVIVGAGDVGQLICRRLIEDPERNANVVGFVDRKPKIRHPDLAEHLMILGESQRLPEIVAELQVERVVVAFSNEPISDLLPILRELQSRGIQIDVVPWLFELIGPDAFVDSVEDLPLIGLPRQGRSVSSNVGRLVRRRSPAHSKNGVATSNT